jgi:hypothetical protein
MWSKYIFSILLLVVFFIKPKIYQPPLVISQHSLRGTEEYRYKTRDSKYWVWIRNENFRNTTLEQYRHISLFGDSPMYFLKGFAQCSLSVYKIEEERILIAAEIWLH